MNLYVWEGVLCDWSCGVVFAFARNIKEAKAAVNAQETVNEFFHDRPQS